MGKNSFANECRLICLCARLKTSGLAQNEISLLLNGPLDWNKIKDLSIRHEILPFLYYNLKRFNLQNLIPEKISALTRNCYYGNLLRNTRIEKEVSFILESAAKEGITIIPFKGFSLIQTLYRSNPGLRIMVDVDMLIKKEDFQKTKNILIQFGYRTSHSGNSGQKKNKIPFEIIFSKTLSEKLISIIEIHSALSPARPYPLKLPELWKRTRETSLYGRKISLLSAEDTFLSLAMHLRRHLRRLTLKFIIDPAELLDNRGNGLDWGYIAKASKDTRIKTTVYLALYLAKELLDANAPDKILKQFYPNIIKRALINFLINKRNFFTLKKTQAVFLRFLLFDRLSDLYVYLLRVSFFERFIIERAFGKTDTKQKTPAKNRTKIKI